jgi:hypothetical protein
MAAFRCDRFRLGVVMTFVLVLSAGVASAKKFQAEPTTLIYRIVISGAFAGIDPQGKMLFHVSGPATVPKVTSRGVVLDPPKSPFGQFSSDLSIDPFDFASPPPIVPWGCGNCTLTLRDGSELTTYGPIQMDGRALFLLGPVLDSAASHENPNVTTIRMAGCGGIQGTAGPRAGQVGTLCANGIFSFDASNPTTITGESHCTITLHSPAGQP